MLSRMRSEQMSFENDEGHHLAARCDLPDSEPTATAVFAHCFTCTKNLRAIGNITSALTDLGIAVLRFDFTGLGESEGDFADSNFSTNVSDLVTAARHVGERMRPVSLLIGHSLGGAAAILAARNVESVQAVATIGAPSSPDHVIRHIEDVGAIEREGQAQVLLVGRPFTIKRQFLEDLEGHVLADALGRLDAALLILHAPLDATVGVANAAELFEAARHPKSFVVIPKADHMLTDDATSSYVGALIGAWASAYV